jgi:hypothetical protein
MIVPVSLVVVDPMMKPNLEAMAAKKKKKKLYRTTTVHFLSFFRRLFHTSALSFGGVGTGVVDCAPLLL